MIVRYCLAALLALGAPHILADEVLDLPVAESPLYEVNFVDTELSEFIDSVSQITGITFIAVSYTHLTLPTTPYV